MNEAWVGGILRKLPAFMLRKEAETMALSIFGKRDETKCRVLARDMRQGFTVVCDDSEDYKRSLKENREAPGTIAGAGGADVQLYVRPQRGAQERHKVALMTALRAVIHERLVASPKWLPTTHRLRSTGPGGCFWVQDIASLDGELVFEDVFHRSKPYSVGSAVLKNSGVDVDSLSAELKVNVDEWRALPAPAA